MRKLLLGTMLMAIAGPAGAADMPVKAPVAMKLAYNWSGFYVGANGGYAKGIGGIDIEPGPSAATFVNLLPQTLDPGAKGFFGGGQVGTNSQYGWFVAGLEADLQSGISGTVTESPIIQNNGTPFPGAGNLTASQKLDWWGTARVRLGTTAVDPRLLLFVTGGVAFGQFNGTANTDFRPVGTEQYPATLSQLTTGLVAGAGAEWAFTDALSVKAEYLFVDLGSNSVLAQPVPPLPPFTILYNFHSQMQVVRAGLNWKLGSK